MQWQRFDRIPIRSSAAARRPDAPQRRARWGLPALHGHVIGEPLFVVMEVSADVREVLSVRLSTAGRLPGEARHLDA